jgi:hypothetical protein
VLLLITFDLDRPVRGFVRVPEKPLIDLRASMELPPAARARRAMKRDRFRSAAAGSGTQTQALVRFSDAVYVADGA